MPPKYTAMDRRLVAVIFASVAFLLIWAQYRPSPEGPSIIFISIDALRADRVGAYGYKRPITPNIDALATDSIIFFDHVTPFSLTLPSHTTMFSGLPARSHGVRQNTERLPVGITLLPEKLQAMGYETGGFVSARVLDEDTGFSRGFQTYHAGIVARANGTIDLAKQWLSKDRGKFFLFIHLWDPHYPYDPPMGYRHFGETIPDLYDGDIMFADEQLGRLFHKLKDRGIYDDALIIVTADHGESLADHNDYFGHDRCAYDECLKVPLIVKLPGGKSRQVRKQTSHTGLMEYVLAYARDEEPPMPYADPAFIEVRHDNTRDATDGVSYAVRSGGLKYIRDGKGAERLYDLSKDPGETSDMLMARPDDAKDLSAALDEWLSATSEGQAGGRVSEATMEALRALGYV